jgi:RNA polymerase sigma-70 factor (ECF subfamily)
MPIITMSEPGSTIATQELDEIFNAHAQLVYRTAFGVTGSHEDAEDVLQTIFLRLIRREFPPDLQKNPKAYFYRAAVNLSLDTIRLRRRTILIEGSELVDLPSPVQDSVDDEQHRWLYEEIAKLKPEAAELLIQRYVHHKSDAEIARMLGVSRGSIALKLFRSRARLKKLLRARLEGRP